MIYFVKNIKKTYIFICFAKKSIIQPAVRVKLLVKN